MIFDTHAHYDDRQFEEDREELLDSMRENGVELIVDAGSDIASWDKIEQLTDRYPFIYGAIGVHPHPLSFFFVCVTVHNNSFVTHKSLSSEVLLHGK